MSELPNNRARFFLLLIALVLVVRLLCSHIEAATDQGIRIDIVDRVTLHSLYKLV